MKRLMNAYSLARDIRILEGEKINKTIREKLVLWTIIKMRWPLLAQCLERDPGRIKYIVTEGGFNNPNIFDGNNNVNIDSDVKKLFSDKDVIGVIKGKEVGGPLDEHWIRRLIANDSTRSDSQILATVAE